MELSEDEVFEICVYQIGALLGFCRAEGIALNHVEPHGQLYLTAVRDPATARGIVRAVRAVDPDLLLLMYGDVVARECARHGVTMVHEGYVDLDYDAEGHLVLERAKRGRSPEAILAEVMSVLDRGGRRTVDERMVRGRYGIHLPSRRTARTRSSSPSGCTAGSSRPAGASGACASWSRPAAPPERDDPLKPSMPWHP